MDQAQPERPLYFIGITVSQAGELKVSMPDDSVIGLRILDAAREVMEKQYQQNKVAIASPYDVLPTILKGIKP